MTISAYFLQFLTKSGGFLAIFGRFWTTFGKKWTCFGKNWQSGKAAKWKKLKVESQRLDGEDIRFWMLDFEF